MTVQTAVRTQLGPLLQAFFIDYLREQKHLSDQTIGSYRDTFRLLLRTVERETNIEPASLTIDHVDAPRILAFLDALEKETGK
jgi:hypothetical protein